MSVVADPTSRVQVSVRVRPLGKGDQRSGKIVVRGAEGGDVVVDDEQRTKRVYHFDHVFSGGQAEVFEAIGRPMLREAYKGFNVCLFAYGQTGSGKTYSLLGDMGCEERAGVAPRFVRCLFDEAQRMVDEDADLTIKVSLSMIEVYMEKVRDLLAPRQRGQEPESLEIHEDPSRRVYVRGASVHQVLSAERMIELLQKGNANRQTAETRMNETSSRSHAIMQISLSQEFACVKKKDLECVVSLVDLAGSERQTKTESSGQQFEEAKKINHSLLMLGRALNSFSDRKGSDAFISLRESKLTRLLSESFGGNSKTWMLATVSPTAFNLTESISTLDYATNAMAITNKAKVNKSSKDLEYSDLIRLRQYLDGSVAREKGLAESYESQVAELRADIAALNRELLTLNDSQMEVELQEALTERDALVSEMVSKLAGVGVGGARAPLVCFCGTCKTSLCSIPLGSYEVNTLVVPLYDLVGPPPLLQCNLHVLLTEANEVMVVVELVELHHLPDFATDGVRVSIWFEGQASSRVVTPIVSSNGGNPKFNFKQVYIFGPMTDELRRFFSADVLYLQVEGITSAADDSLERDDAEARCLS
ncbi:kinesin [Leishmania donovani]|uniref:Kinesin_-_putative n=4 Tax=Leishmania donovani species complex TaxID=38574 RepID=A0A6L0XKG5_LEIIN|nr:putative kinesin [Leishmania infantum JPCM5]AYU80743.1 kinesin, putative [Leishmania donovani]CAC9510236.1 kinesin_-_putative [Leishmania infantum]TPP50660.1 Kinesin motor domain family protein [Leishmania donovani]CAJ1990731.1 kinesin [Leishmania donovani]CAM69818.1 putative kinesin [Leishmania infantum JPCM5]|eukprot:XP_001466771.1 putative kinesin [Leishmania infantum JPCM5]